MQVKNYLRLAFILADNNAETLRKNLEKMVALVIYDATEDKSYSGLEIPDIAIKLKESYGLSFSETEILDAINNSKNKAIIRFPGESPPIYCITPGERSKISNKVSDNTLDHLIDEFSDYEKSLDTQEKLEKEIIYEALNIENSSKGDQEKKPTEDINVIVHEKFKDLLFQYFYMLFNSNASIIRSFLGGEEKIYSKISDSNFTELQKLLINSFLYWENPEKDEFVYRMLSCCYDYCVMTIGKENRNYSQVFNNKFFYLDTNVVFRLMGLNHENRRQVIDAFVSKCKSVNIKIAITNFTKKEINDSIEYNINNLKSVLGANQPADASIATIYTDGYCNPGFYETYEKWCRDKDNKVGDYSSFERHLKKLAFNIEKECLFVGHEVFTSEDKYNDLVQSLLKYKQDNHRRAIESSVKVDVSNYLLVREKNDNPHGSTFLDTQHYMISADHVYGDWAREQRPGTVPIVVLPSVWYSIILRYAGRNENDYTAFTRFLNFSLNDGRQGKKDANRLAIFQKVISKQEPMEIKNDVLFDIETKLQEQHDYNYPGLDDNDIEEIVNDGIESVTQQRIREAVEREHKISEAKIENVKAETSAQLRLLSIKSEAEIIEAKQQSKQQEALAKSAKEEGTNQEHNRIIDKLSAENAAKSLKIYIAIAIIIAIIECVIFFEIWKWAGEDQNSKSEIQRFLSNTDNLKWVFAAFSVLIDLILYKGVFCTFDIEKIEKRKRKQLDRKLQ